MGFNEWDAQLREDIGQIQMVESHQQTEEAKIWRIQYIATASALRLMRRMGALAAGAYLHELAKRIEAEGKGDVH